MASKPELLIGSDVGGYVVEALLGEGGMGLVFRARHPILNRHFAIKVLRPEAAADARISVNFEREAQTLSSLKHPHIIDIVGFGALSDGRQYMVMEFVKGQTLEDELISGGPIEVHRALKLADQILDGLDAAHSVGVIHRDMKPSNVLIAKVSGGTEVLKLLDFGLAKQQPESLVGKRVAGAAGESVIAGTPEYIAPEQAQGKHAGKHSDIYSFGVVLFQMLTGVLPFEPEEGDPDRIRTLLQMHAVRPAPLISAHARAGSFPIELEELVADLLNKNPSERPSSAATVRARVQKLQRTLDRESTQLVQNPLLAEPATRHPPTQPVLRVSQTEKELPAGKKRRGPVLVAGLGVVLAAGVWGWLSTRPIAAPLEEPVTELQVEPVVVPAVEPAAVAVAAVAPAAQSGDELVALDDELAALKVKRVRPAGCAPDADWKKRSRADLNELVTRAAKLNADISLWAAYQEGPLSAAIEAASSHNECGAVNQKLALFKAKVKGK